MNNFYEHESLSKKDNETPENEGLSKQLSDQEHNIGEQKKIWSVLSFGLGVISLIAIMVYLYIKFFGESLIENEVDMIIYFYVSGYVLLALYFSAFSSAIFAIVFGIPGVKHKKLLSVLGIVLGIICIGIIGVDKLSDPYGYGCERLETIEEKDECYYEVMYYEEDPSACEKIQDQNKKDECYSWSSVQHKDCEVIENQELKEQCYTTVARDTGNLALCEKIENELKKDFCYTGVASTNGDLYVCEKIKNQIQREKSCYKGVALNNLDLSICDKISDLENRETCYSGVYFRLAGEHLDSSFCDKINDLEDRESCRSSVGSSIRFLEEAQE